MKDLSLTIYSDEKPITLSVMGYKTIKELHNYEIPEISTIQTSNVDKDYEKWLKDFVEK